jgi:predicted transcriptional regulator
MTEDLSKRERQIMDILHESGQATAAEVLERLPNPPSYSATRALLRILEEKGHIKHEQQGPRYLFRPIASQKKARRLALDRFMRTFCNGSAEEMVAALLDSRTPSRQELERLSTLIENAKKEGR